MLDATSQPNGSGQRALPPAAESVLLARRLALSRPKRRPKPHHEAN
jgi:hypothetical protein